MATIKGKSILNAIEKHEVYKLETEEAIKEGITWTISVKSGTYKKTKPNHGRYLSIDFDNKIDEQDLTLIIKAEYPLIDGTKKEVTKEVTLLGYTKEKVNKYMSLPRFDTGNKSVVVNVPDPNKQKAEKKGIILKIHVYFDGTFGNKENIRVMELSRDKNLGEKKPDIHDNKYKTTNETGYRTINRDQYEKELKEYREKVKAKKDKIQNEVDKLTLLEKWTDIQDSKNPIGEIGKTIGYSIGADPTSDNNSYTQVYTNIPIIFDMEEVETEGDEDSYEKILKVYIEGVGTQNFKGDDFMALSTGSDSGGMGIPSKVARAFEEIKEEADKSKITNDIIKKVEICIIGFSRGAATARNFVGERNTMLSILEKINKNISDDIITYKFVGIFDTVCSVTDFTQFPKFRDDTIRVSAVDTYITSLQKNNVQDYKLAMGGNAEEIVHLVAADEHRLFFPLTNIDSSIDAGKGFELVLPGGHCDLGGGDPDIQEESFNEIVNKGNEKDSLAENYLIKNNWYPQTEPHILTDTIEVSHFMDNQYMRGEVKIRKEIPVGKQYSLNRKVIAGYNRIPLAIMLHFAEKLGKLIFKEKDDFDRTKVHEELMPLKAKLLNYAKNNHKPGRDTTPVTLFNREFQHLRVKYLHMSSALDFSYKLSEEISNIAKIKDVAARLDSNDFPSRALISDTNDSNWLKEKGKKLWNAIDDFTEKAIDATKEAVEKALDAAKEAEAAAKKIIK